jgi:glycosyltransferase involved in cell wall biosynthesis
MKRLSVLMPSYNHGRFLARALSAIVNQSRPPDEVIVVDDCSTDDTPLILRDYANRYDFIKVHTNEQNVGCAESTETATKLAAGDFLQLCASDDWMLPGCIETLMGLVDRFPNAGIVSAPMTYFDESKEDGFAIPKDAGVLSYHMPDGFYGPGDSERLFASGPMSILATLAPSTLFNARLVREFGSWPTDLGMHGASLILRAAALHSGMAYSNKPIYNWVYRNTGITADELASQERSRMFLQRQAGRMKEPPFDRLFSGPIRARWDRESEESLRPKRRLSVGRKIIRETRRLFAGDGLLTSSRRR